MTDDTSLDEKETRRLIDAKLRAVGWEADTENIRFSKDSVPQAGKNKAIAEWPTESGPADYALFVGLKLLGVVEAKRMRKNVPGALEQSKRYSRGIKSLPDDIEPLGSWDDFKVPFLFATNGREFLGQLQEQSGIWFQDVRLPTNHPRPLVDWFTPGRLLELSGFNEVEANQKLRDDPSSRLASILRPYQLTAIEKIEETIRAGQRTALVAMATGTGKTRTCIGLAYRLIKSGRFKKVLFLVDRTALGDQAADAFENLKLDQGKSFDEIYDLFRLEEKVSLAERTGPV